MISLTGMICWVLSFLLMLWAPSVTVMRLHTEQGGGWGDRRYSLKAVEGTGQLGAGQDWNWRGIIGNGALGLSISVPSASWQPRLGRS